SGTASAMTTPSVTTTNAIDILYAAGASNRTVSTVGTSFTSRSKSYDNMVEDRAVTATGAYTATETQNGTAWVMQTAAFKAAGSSGPPVDSTPPSISITTPTTNAVVSGTVPVSGTAADNVGVSSVAVTIDNGTYVAATGTTSWSSSVNVSA